MADKKKHDPNQPELIPSGAATGAGKRETESPAPAHLSGGESHVVAEAGAVGLATHRPFEPAKTELALHKRVNTNFLEYASYVIRDRAIPHLADGLKPVQRRIMWGLHEKDDGRFIKVANIAGHCMQYHPHGEASIGDALVVLANKRYLIEGQGNFGNIYTGDAAAAPRYIECRLTELARRELFHDEITDFVSSYDGRAKEPIVLPCKLPLLLMLGAEGIAVGLSVRILPHNFPELLQAQMAILRNQPFKLLPDFQTGGLMDAREYADGQGSIKVRARIKERDGESVVITEIPPTTTTDSLIGSIEDAARKGKIKIRSIQDFTSEKVEIEVRAPQGVSTEKLMDALYAFTDCEVSISSRIAVIKDKRPVEMTVSEVLRENTSQLLGLLRRELELKEKQLGDELHAKTLVRIFIENRLYKRIETCQTQESVNAAIVEGFKPHRKEMRRDLSGEDLEMLLGVRIRRISLFDIAKHKEEIEKIEGELASTRKHLKNISAYALQRLQGLLDAFGPLYPRQTRSSRYDEVDAKEVAFKAFKVAYDRESGYLGYKVSGEEYRVDCTKFDKLLLVFKDGHYRVVELPEKLFVGPDLIYAAVPDRDQVMTLAYTNREATYLKRFTFGGTILNKEYECIPPKSKILFFDAGTPETLYIKYKPAPYQKIHQQTCHPSEVAVKGAKTRGNQISIKDVSSIGSKPPRGWDSEAPMSKLQFA
ncbi:MAG: DNA topoisomerase IV subunit A [Verrucomicrobia bacterium]|nr:DNA topoisomerase IV subunit A [Verrucomicrobiota bacterium]